MNQKPFNDTSYEQSLNEEKIMGSKCKKCGALALPPRPICVSCFSSEMEWVELKGTGKLGGNAEGTLTFVGGTGKFVGIQGSGTFTTFSLQPAAEGTTQAYTKSKGQYKLP